MGGAKIEGQRTKPDWISTSYCISTLEEGADKISPKDEEATRCVIEEHVPEILKGIFGLGLGERCKGANNYPYGWKIKGDCGFVYAGHQTKRFLIQLSGTGCTFAKNGWNQRLYDFLMQANKPKIVRMDLALDDFNGQMFDVRSLYELMWKKGYFNNNGRPPRIAKLGDWWTNDEDESGITFTVGSRGNAKYFRGYERGKKIGDTSSRWFRAEIEFLAAHAYLPFDMLLNPDSYYAGAYPATAKLLEMFDPVDIELQRIEYIKKESKISAKKSIEHIDHQFGGHIHFHRQYGGMTDTELLDAFTENFRRKNPNKIPKRLQFTSYAALILAQNNEIIKPDDFSPVSFFNEKSALKQPVNQTMRN